MDYLGLTNRYLIETGVADTVASLVGVGDDVTQGMQFINNSWLAFQRSRWWPFRRAEGSVNVTNGKTSYTWTDLSLNSGDIIIAGSFYNASGTITQEPYFAVRKRRRDGNAHDTSRLYYVAVRQDGGTTKLETYPDVDTTQALAFDYIRACSEMALNTDVPTGLPDDYHMMIVHAAVARYGLISGGEEGRNLYQHHGTEAKRIYNEYMLYAGLDAEEEITSAQGTLLG